MYLISSADNEISIKKYNNFDEAFLAMMDSFVQAIKVSEKWQLAESEAYANGKVNYCWRIVKTEPKSISHD